MPIAFTWNGSLARRRRPSPGSRATAPQTSARLHLIDGLPLLRPDGRQPGQPMNPVSLQVHLRKIGVPPQRGRTSAIRQLLLQAPAPVIAKALGYHDKTATRLVTEAGGTWSRYAPGDHTR